jgi:putative ABC transport system ATP-binding protein
MPDESSDGMNPAQSTGNAPAVRGRVSDVSLPSDNPVLDARGLVFPAGGSVLNQAALAVGEGETIAVLGAPGAGKSTLMACLSGEAAAAEGAVWTNGKPVHLLSPEQRHAFRLRHYGLVHQDTLFLPELTLAQSAALPLRFAGMGERAAKHRVRTWFSRFEIENAADRRPTQLSTGIAAADALSAEKRSFETQSAEARSVETLRRAALARAMVNDPLVLLADEPFVGLSEESSDTTARILHSIARSHGTAVIVFTSDADTARRCRRIVHLVAGRTTVEPTPAAAVEPVRPVDFSITAPDSASPSPARVRQ